MIAGLNREQMVSRLEEWLKDALTTEKPPEGIEEEIWSALAAETETPEDAQDETSSYALWSAMTALSQEVKLQGRAFKELATRLDLQAASIGDEIRAAYRERERDIEREAERRARKQILGSFVDLRDRLERGLQSAKTGISEIAKARQRNWLNRIFSRQSDHSSAPILASLIRGYELGLDRLDQTLEDFNARPIASLGRTFDPRSMNAIERENSDKVPEGTVMEVYRTGYEWNGEVFRPAQVKVSVAINGEVAND